MSVDLNYYSKIQNLSSADSIHDAEIEEQKLNISYWMNTSVGLRDGYINGVATQFVVKQSDTLQKADIVCFPDTELNVGDIVQFDDQHWIVVKLNFTNPFQRIGLCWLCNFKLRWQDATTAIQEVWSVLDTGTYSTSVTSDFDVQAVHKQYKLYVPYTDTTSKLYVDKRFAVAQRYDKDGEQILDTYRITGYDPISSSYGNDGHLLILSVVSTQFDTLNDNVELMLCDYMQSATQPTGSITATITGTNTIRIGRSKAYIAEMPNATSINWTTPTITGITFTANQQSLIIAVTNNEELLGTQFTIVAHDNSSVYADAIKEIEVVSVG